MTAITSEERDLFARGSIETRTRMARGPAAPGLARRFVCDAISVELSPGRIRDLTLMTSELVTNAVEYSDSGTIDVTVASGGTCTRIAVSTPNASWQRAPESHQPEAGQTSGWGLFLVEQLSNRWGTCAADYSVWFDLDHPPSSPKVVLAADEEKALFTDAVNAVDEAFGQFDEGKARRAMSDDLRSGQDRREVSMTVAPADERRGPNLRRRRRQGDAG